MPGDVVVRRMAPSADRLPLVLEAAALGSGPRGRAGRRAGRPAGRPAAARGPPHRAARRRRAGHRLRPRRVGAGDGRGHSGRGVGAGPGRRPPVGAGPRRARRGAPVRAGAHVARPGGGRRAGPPGRGPVHAGLAGAHARRAGCPSRWRRRCRAAARGRLGRARRLAHRRGGRPALGGAGAGEPLHLATGRPAAGRRSGGLRPQPHRSGAAARLHGLRHHRRLRALRRRRLDAR